MKNPVFEISYSKIRTYLNCSWLYKLKFQDNFKAPPSPESSLGVSVHKALEKFYKEGAKSEADLISCLDDVWERPGYADSAQELDFYDKARTILETYWRKIASQWQGKVEAVEKTFALEFPDLGVRLMGTVDRLDRLPDGTHALVEYKTHAQPWDEKRIREDLQMTLYFHALSEGLNLKPLKAYFFFVSQGILVESSRSPADWESASLTIKETAISIQAGKYSPNTDFCSFCEMKHACPYSTVKEIGVRPL